MIHQWLSDLVHHQYGKVIKNYAQIVWQKGMRWVQRIVQKIIQKTPQRYFLISLVVTGLLLIFLISRCVDHHVHINHFAQQNTTQNPALPETTPAGDYIQKQLNGLSNQLSQLKTALGTYQQQDTQKWQDQLSNMIGQIKQLSALSNQMILQEIQTNTTQLRQQLQTIHQQLVTLQKAQQHIKYLKAEDLPFQVISIDNIQQNNVVSVEYAHTIFPMEVGDYLVSWKLIRADFAEQQAEFVNAKQQHVIVDLHRLQAQV